MYFFLSKTMGTLLVLPNLLLAAGILGLALLPTRYGAIGRRTLLGAFVALAISGVTPIGNLMLLPLENRFPPWTATGTEPTGLIILGGQIDTGIATARNEISPVEADRLIEAAKLARKYPRARIIYTGGTSKLLGSDVREADYATQILETLGIPGSRIEIEREARNTAENATFGKLMASPKAGDHWLLITSASHMPRAIGLFCAAGFNVEAVPTGWRTTGHLDLFRLDGIADGLVLTGIATREWLGLIASRLFGDTGALLPGPCA